VHHKKLFVVMLTQNFFQKTGETRTRRLNAQYMIIFKNPSDVTQIVTIGRHGRKFKSISKLVIFITEVHNFKNILVVVVVSIRVLMIYYEFI
jgi:hypothetical protein